MALDDILGQSGETDGILNEIATGGAAQNLVDILVNQQLIEGGLYMEVTSPPVIIVDIRRSVR
jgi:hypothetical protein